jgi:hypothetical protein
MPTLPGCPSQSCRRCFEGGSSLCAPSYRSLLRCPDSSCPQPPTARSAILANSAWVRSTALSSPMPLTDGAATMRSTRTHKSLDLNPPPSAEANLSSRCLQRKRASVAPPISLVCLLPNSDFGSASGRGGREGPNVGGKADANP